VPPASRILGCGPRQHLRALEVVGELDEGRSCDDLDFGTSPCRFGPARRRADQSFAPRIGADGGRQDAGDRSDRAVEAEFTKDRKSGQRVVRNADRGHEAKRDRQVIVAAFLGQIGRCEVDRDPSCRQGKPGRNHRRAHPLARLRNRLVGKTDDGEGRHAGRDLYLDHATVVTRWTMPAPALASHYRNLTFRAIISLANYVDM
jgi:hypothetical protein